MLDACLIEEGYFSFHGGYDNDEKFIVLAMEMQNRLCKISQRRGTYDAVLLSSPDGLDSISSQMKPIYQADIHYMVSI